MSDLKIEKSIELFSEQDTTRLAKQLAVVIQPATTIFLNGELGSGKTFFVRAFINALGFTGKVKSPTYNILETYQINQYQINHFDLYRFESALEWYDLGFDDISSELAINFIEWSERISDNILIADVTIWFSYVGLQRICTLQGNTVTGKELIAQWIN